MKWRWLILLVMIGVLLAGVYGTAGALVYTTATAATAQCLRGPAAWQNNTPAAFDAGGTLDVDLSPYTMPHYETVTLSSREDGLTLAAWYIPAAETDAPAVIVVHGLNSCRRAPQPLYVAGMLHRAGFHVLIPDLRNHGDSTVSAGRMAGGIAEYRDVLGGWDWLVQTPGIAPDRIGLLGLSLGAATVMIAGGEEAQVAAVWADSPYADIEKAILDELARNGYPPFLAPAGILMGRVIDGVDITARSPLQAAIQMERRPLFVVHGDADTRLPVEHSLWLAEVLEQQGRSLELWIAPGSGHLAAMFDYPQEYESRLIDFFSTHLND